MKATKHWPSDSRQVDKLRIAPQTGAANAHDFRNRFSSYLHRYCLSCATAFATRSATNLCGSPKDTFKAAHTADPLFHLWTSRTPEEEVTRTIPYKAIMQRKQTQVGAVRTSCKDTLPFSDAAKVYYDGSLVSVEVVHFQVLFCLTSKR